MKRKFFLLAIIAAGFVLAAASASALPGGPIPRPIPRPGIGDQPVRSDN